MKSSHDLLQLALPMLMEVPRPRFLANELLSGVDSDAKAIRVCFAERIRKFTKGEIAQALGISPCHLAKVFAGTFKLDGTQKKIFQYMCSNFAIAQFEGNVEATICEATETPAEKIARLEHRVAQLEARRAA